jgi:hypothetical protein
MLYLYILHPYTLRSSTSSGYLFQHPGFVNDSSWADHSSFTCHVLCTILSQLPSLISGTHHVLVLSVDSRYPVHFLSRL